MNDAERLKDYEVSANEWDRWLMSAKDLEYVIDFLDKAHQQATEEMKSNATGYVPQGFDFYKRACYFKGKCLELYLKAFFIKNGGKITNGEGKLNTLGGHDLIKLCQKNNFAISNEEKSTLEKLTNAVTFWGTYPVPLNYKKWREDVEGIVGLQPIHHWGKVDNSNFLNISNRLKGILVNIR